MAEALWFTPTSAGVRVSLPGPVCALLAAIGQRLPPLRSTAAVDLPADRADDPLARWEIEEKQERLEKQLQAARDASDDAVLPHLDVEFDGVLSLELSRDEASLWLQWLNRHYVVLRAGELDEVSIGEEQSLLMLMGSELFGEEPGANDTPKMSVPTMYFAYCGDQLIDALRG